MTSLHGEGGEVVDVTIEAVRDRFHTLNVPLAFFDGPAGTQCPDSVIEAVSGYLLTANANSGGKFLTSMVTDDVIGLFSSFTPKFVKRYSEVGTAVEEEFH